VQIIDHKHEEEQGKTLYSMFPELAGIHFTPNPTCPDKDIPELGVPAGDQAADKEGSGRD